MATVRKLPYKPRLKGPERRARIEDAAAPLFAERGYAETSLEDVAAAAGVSRPVIYDHFESKRDLHEALLERHTRELLAFIAEKVTAESGGLEARLRAGVNAFFEFMQGDLYAWRMILSEPLAEGRVAVVDRRLQNEVTAGLAALIEQSARESGADLGGPDRAFRFAEGMKWACNGLGTWWYEHRDVDREVLVETVMDLCWRGLERVAEDRRGPQ
jgi:AcrR family transcriptional regulator